MRGVDTNVLVRYIVKDDRKQAEQATAFIRKAAESGKICFINCVVLCELVWVLESAYEYSKEEITHVLEMILMIKQFEIEIKDIVRQAVHDYKNGKADIADYLIGRINHAGGCEITATFDRNLINNSNFDVLD
jgi:predicted nucleic-acid-binding protein